jgi:hypothetical protein
LEIVKLTDFIVGGYYLIQGAPIQKWMNAELLPPILWSASSCICKKVPDAWVFPWTKQPDPQKERKFYQDALGLNDNEFIGLQQLFDKHLRENEFGYPNVFMSYQIVQHACFQFFCRLPNLKLVSIALPENEVQDFIDKFEPHGNIAENGVPKKLRQYQKLEPHAMPVGYEVIGFDGADFHSLICSSMEEEVNTEYGVHFNRYGLIDKFDEAVRIVQDIRLGNLIVEEGYWAPWLISEYPTVYGD